MKWWSSVTFSAAAVAATGISSQVVQGPPPPNLNVSCEMRDLLHGNFAYVTTTNTGSAPAHVSKITVDFGSIQTLTFNDHDGDDVPGNGSKIIPAGDALAQATTCAVIKWAGT